MYRPNPVRKLRDINQRLTKYKSLTLGKLFIIRTLVSKGNFLDIHIDSNTKYVLYAIDMCFVEVKWDIEKDDNSADWLPAFAKFPKRYIYKKLKVFLDYGDLGQIRFAQKEPDNTIR